MANLYTSWDIITSRFVVAILGVTLPVKSNGIVISPIRMLDSWNIGGAVGISLLTFLQAEISLLPGFVATIFDFALPVESYSIVISPIRMQDPWNIGLTVGISLLSSLQAEISSLPVLLPPYWL